MAKKPKSSEVMMFGEKKHAEQKLQRAEIITRGADGKVRVEQAGVVQTPAPQPARAPKPAAPAPTAAKTPAAPAPRPEPAPAPRPAAAAAPAVSKAAPKPAAGASPKAHSQAIAHTVVTGFVDKLRAEAERRGGYISVTDLEGMQAEFHTQAAELSRVFEQSFEAYVRARERAVWDQARQYPFDRALVKRFSHLFKIRPGRDTVSRRMLPGFFLAISMMLGPDAVESYQGRVRVVVERIRDGREEFDWEDVYAAPEVRRLVIDAQVAILSHFKDFDRRSAWFINLVNSNLAPAPEGASKAELEWELTDAGFRRFLGAFLKELRDMVTAPEHRPAFAERHGPQAVEDIIRVLKKLDGFD